MPQVSAQVESMTLSGATPSNGPAAESEMIYAATKYLAPVVAATSVKIGMLLVQLKQRSVGVEFPPFKSPDPQPHGGSVDTTHCAY